MMGRSKATEFNEVVQFKAPEGFSKALRTAALMQHTTVSEFLRRVVYERIEESSACQTKDVK